MNFREESIQLVAAYSDQNFYLTNEGRAFLNSLERPLAIVSIAGMYRTGKSYLVNRLIKSKGGFKTGGGSQAVTRGLSVWGRPIYAEDQDGQEMCYLVIDSEGTGSLEQETKYDMKLLMLVFLISSTVVYNSVGAIDQLALDQLRVVVNLRQSLGSKVHWDEKTRLVWVLRDFALQLIDRHGQQMTSKEYLQQCLEETGTGFEARKKNQIRRALKEGLGRRSCYTLVRPTINEEDLADLSGCKIRSEFVNQIQEIREQVFGGSREDVKRMQGVAVNGRILVRMLQGFIDALNSNECPRVGSVWESAKQMANEEVLDEILSSLKSQVGRIILPLGREQLKYKLNQIQNNFYVKLEQSFMEVEGFKKAHKELLRCIQKTNRDVKKANSGLIRERILKSIRSFVRQNIHLQNVQPTNLSLVKVLVDRLELKTKGQIEGYEYILGVIYDLMHISQQKATGLQRQLAEQRKIAQIGSIERKNVDMSCLSLKQDYHQALKTIANLKLHQQELEKQCALLKNQLQMVGNRSQSLIEQAEIKQMSLLRQIQELGIKSKQRIEESGVLVKRLRQQNQRLEEQLQQVRGREVNNVVRERKQVIFEQKIKETWDKFQEERKYLKGQLQKHKKESNEYRRFFEDEYNSRIKQKEQFEKQREGFNSKERQFVHQLRELKSLHLQTKKTYCATFDTLKDNDRIFRNIQNVSASHAKLATSCKKQLVSEDKESQMNRRYYEGQMEKVRNNYEDQNKYLNVEINRLNQLYELEKTKNIDKESQIKSYKEDLGRLERELAICNQRFIETLSEIQSAKQRQRSLYEESIVRLLSNIERRQSTGQQFQSSRR